MCLPPELPCSTYLLRLSRCEHYNFGNKDHLITYDAGSGLYDTPYLEALFRNDTDTVKDFEFDAFYEGTGPLISDCPTVYNFSSVKVNCRVFSLGHIVLLLIVILLSPRAPQRYW